MVRPQYTSSRKLIQAVSKRPSATPRPPVMPVMSDVEMDMDSTPITGDADDWSDLELESPVEGSPAESEAPHAPATRDGAHDPHVAHAADSGAGPAAGCGGESATEEGGESSDDSMPPLDPNAPRGAHEAREVMAVDRAYPGLNPGMVNIIHQHHHHYHITRKIVNRHNHWSLNFHVQAWRHRLRPATGVIDVDEVDDLDDALQGLEEAVPGRAELWEGEEEEDTVDEDPVVTAAEAEAMAMTPEDIIAAELMED